MDYATLWAYVYFLWWAQMSTLYVSKGITDTWSNHITPAMVVVNWSLDLGFEALASNSTSTFFQSDTSEAEALEGQSSV